MSRFNPQAFTTFEYTNYSFDRDTGVIRLTYTLLGDTEPVRFTEEVTVPIGADSSAIGIAERLVRLLFLAAGVSYYKAAIPPEISIKTQITHIERDFLVAILEEGLTEFAYVNNVPQALRPHIKVEKYYEAQPLSLLVAEDAPPLVPVGGGKDSVVTIEALRSIGITPLLFSVNGYEPIQNTVKRSGLEYVQAHRHIDPQLMDFNKNGAYNGHVPVTAINSLIALIAAVTLGSKTVIFSNERSASAGNTIWQGIEVNHQWSKSGMFEYLLQQILAKNVSPDLEYFSLLRPFSELRIARKFAELTEYHSVFTSCNRAFHIDKTKREIWCGHCDKCRFVFLILAPYLSKTELVAIFRKNLFEDGEQLGGFRELLGISGHKPLECIGEITESRVALVLASKKNDWRESVIVRLLLAELPEDMLPTVEQEKEVFAAAESFVPDAYRGAFDFI
jgi:hypothetical protein